ncbi:MAG: hypothetical protein ACI8W7_002946 [Gammaproteobacteria bacterium]|jgi:uncharacterized protein (TIGR02466 family)
MANGTQRRPGSAAAKTMSRDLFFPTPIFYTDLHDGVAINAHIASLIYQWRVDDPHGELRTNEPQSGGWHSRTQMHTRREYDPLTAQIFEFIHGVFIDMGYDPDFEPACDSMWANINPRHASNRQHTHPRALWSGVYYVQTPADCGLLYFSDPRAQAQVMPPYYDLQRRPADTWHEVHYQPIAGRLVVFPAWLPHAVQPNMSTLLGTQGDRISVSFNFHQQRKRNSSQHHATCAATDQGEAERASLAGSITVRADLST